MSKDWIEWSGIHGDPVYLVMHDGTRRLMSTVTKAEYVYDDEPEKGWVFTIGCENRLVIVVGVGSGLPEHEDEVEGHLESWYASDKIGRDTICHDEGDRIVVRPPPDNPKDRLLTAIFGGGCTKYKWDTAEDFLETWTRVGSVPVEAGRMLRQ